MSRRKARRIAVFQPCAQGLWRAVEAEFRSDRIRILRVGAFGAGNEPAGLPPLIAEATSASDAALVSTSDKAVCRVFAMPYATPEQTRRMAAMRLETELPYPLDASAWGYRSQFGEEAQGDVLVMAVPREDLSEVERAVRAAGRRCSTVWLEAAALAEIAARCSSEDTVALASVNESYIVLVITRRGQLRYARRLPMGTAASDQTSATADAVRNLVNQLDQCLHHYALQFDSPAASHFLLVGEPPEGLAEALFQRIGIPVQRAELPDLVEVQAKETRREDLLRKNPACVGALLAIHAGRRGQASAATPVWERKPTFLETVRVRRAAWIGANALLIAGLFVAMFAGRNARIAMADRVIRQGRGLLQDTDKLRAEVEALRYEDRRRSSILDAVVSLTEVLPKTLKISEITVDARGKIMIKGVAPSVEEASEKAVSAMNASGAFAHAKFLGARKDKNEFTFSISCELRKNAATEGDGS